MRGHFQGKRHDQHVGACIPSCRTADWTGPTS
jgi:hypothetical protein